mgnify:CR=1 FL=1
MLVHVAGGVDPIRDIEIVNLELVLADLDSAERQLEKLKRTNQPDRKAQLVAVTYETGPHEIKGYVGRARSDGTSSRSQGRSSKARGCACSRRTGSGCTSSRRAGSSDADAATGAQPDHAQAPA